MFPDTNKAHKDTMRFSRFQLNGRVLVFWCKRAQNLICLFRVDQSNWTLWIISNDFEIRFQVTLPRNGHTVFTHSLVFTVCMIKTQISLVETTLTKIPRISLGYITGNLKHIVRYVGGAAWHILEFFVARNLNTAKPLAKSEINWTKMQPGR